MGRDDEIATGLCRAFHLLERVWGVRYVGSRGMGRFESRCREMLSEDEIVGGEVRWWSVCRAVVTSGSHKRKGVRDRLSDGGGGKDCGEGRSWRISCETVIRN